MSDTGTLTRPLCPICRGNPQARRRPKEYERAARSRCIGSQARIDGREGRGDSDLLMKGAHLRRRISGAGRGEGVCCCSWSDLGPDSDPSACSFSGTCCSMCPSLAQGPRSRRTYASCSWCCGPSTKSGGAPPRSPRRSLPLDDPTPPAPPPSALCVWRRHGPAPCSVSRTSTHACLLQTYPAAPSPGPPRPFPAEDCGGLAPCSISDGSAPFTLLSLLVSIGEGSGSCGARGAHSVAYRRFWGPQRGG